MTIPYSTSNAAGFNFSDIFVAQTSGYGENAVQVPLPVGTVADGTDGSKCIYVKFGTGGTTGIGYTCVYDEDFLAVMVTTSNATFGDPLGVPFAAALVDNYGWLQVKGTCDSIRVAALCAANVQLLATATAGELDDATGGGTKNLNGIVLTTTAVGAGLSPGELNWPTVGTTN